MGQESNLARITLGAVGKPLSNELHPQLLTSLASSRIIFLPQHRQAKAANESNADIRGEATVPSPTSLLDSSQKTAKEA